MQKTTLRGFVIGKNGGFRRICFAVICSFPIVALWTSLYANSAIMDSTFVKGEVESLFARTWFDRTEFAPPFLVPPSISSISPSTPQRSVTDQIVRVNGSNFASGLTVTVTFPTGGTGTLSGSQIQNRTSSRFDMVVTLNATGTWCIRVNNSNGEVSNTFCFTVATAQTPTISSISPSAPYANNSDQSVSVSGSNFQNGMTVTVFFPGGGSGTLSGTQLQNVTPTSFTMVVTLNLTGIYGIRINNPSGLNSSTFNFTVRPSIISFSPSSLCVRDVNQSVTVNGTGFSSGLTVTVTFPTGGSTTLSGSQIQSVTSSSLTMLATFGNPGNYGIRVNNPNGTQSNTQNLPVQYCTTVSGTNPTSPTQSGNDQNVQVNGSGFASGLTVTLTFPNGQSTVLSGTQITNVTSNSFTMRSTLNATGTWKLRVRNSNGNLSNEHSFSVIAPTPVITSTSPTTPCVRNIDQSVVVNGTGFVAGLTVTVTFPGGGTGTLSGSQIQNVTSTSFTVLITLADPGSYGLRVNNPGGAQSNTFSMPTQNCLNVSGIVPTTPTQGPTNQQITVNGSGFATTGLTATLTFPDGGTATLTGSQIIPGSTTSIVINVTLNASGIWFIKVRNPNGDLSNNFQFNVQAPSPPTVASINPASPTSSNVDQNVIVNGTNFQPGLTVTLFFPGGGSGTLQGTQIQNVTASSFTMRATFGTPGQWSMRVNNLNGGQSTPFGFNVQSNVQQPVIFSINPVSPIARSTDQDVIVTGNNFQSGLTVPITFPTGGGTTLSGSQIQNVTSTSFIMRATLNAAGNWTIRVNNPDGGQSSPFAFSVANGTNPVINSINPAVPLTNGADQNVIVNGSNFQNGLRVNVTFPDGGMATLQGTGQIQNVTANSFVMRITLNAAGNWTIRVINPNDSQSQQFAFNVNPSGPPPTGLPTTVLSPVIGPLRVTTTNQGLRDGKWEFNQHGTGFHTPTGGISLSNDTKAWDVNLYTSTNGNADAGKSVFATAAGQVVSYVGTPPGGGPGAVLIAHPNAASPVWFSGYLHMSDVQVGPNQFVSQDTVIGSIGRVGANNDHLHFVLYSGQNTRGNLLSFTAAINERGAGVVNPPNISGISPSTVTQGSTETLTISGTNFDSTSILEVQAPDGQTYIVTPQTASGSSGLARIESVTATAITATVPFPLANNYGFSVVNRSNGSTSGNCDSSNCLVNAIQGSQRTPVILIPGIMGSRLNERVTGRNLWLGGAGGDRGANQSLLGFNVENPQSYREIAERQVVATAVLRNLDVNGNSIPLSDVYDRLISYLTSPAGGGYTLYPYENPALSNPVCPMQPNADLFLFPYDWRNSNWTSARDLQNFIQCIKTIRGNPSDFKVDIVAHSMGGVVARRYILNNPGTHHVDRMLTLGTPWLGSPKVINALETGRYDWVINQIIAADRLKGIAPYIRGAHELLPSRAYFNLVPTSGRPLWEDGWKDFDMYANTSTPSWQFDFNHFRDTMNYRYPPQPLVRTNPGNTVDALHGQPGQDNWFERNSTGVTYYHFVGTGRGTPGSIVAKNTFWSGRHLEIIDTLGDETVPEVSATRQGLHDYRGSELRLPIRYFSLSHGNLASDQTIFPWIYCVIRNPNPDSCLNQQALNLRSSSIVATGSPDPHYKLNVVGSNEVIISDSFGNTSNPLSTSIDEGVPSANVVTTGDNYLRAYFHSDQAYQALIKTPTTPFSISVLRNDGSSTIQAIRYVDISLPPNVFAQIDFSPIGVSALAYDSNGDGTFDTPVTPTIVVSGPDAADIEAPLLTINETVLGTGSRIEIEATDKGTGVQRIMYSINGTDFQQYSGPLNLNPATVPEIYVFADDNVANRSGLMTHELTPSAVGFSVSGPTVAAPGSTITATFNAPSGRPENDWIGLFAANSLNSAYIAKLHTGGATTGNLNFAAPVAAGTYEFRYLKEDGFISVATSAPIAVTTQPQIDSPFDFDGDGKTDVSVFRPVGGSGSEWWYLRSSDGGNRAFAFGEATDTVVPADFTGDGKTDLAFWRPASGEWFVLRSEDSTFFAFPFGAAGDVPSPADFDGDGKSDATVYRPSTNTWFTLRSSDGQVSATPFGTAGDKPVPADYDGDGKADVAIFRPTGGSGGGEWWYLRSSDGANRAFAFGSATDLTVPGDYTGDGKADLAYFRPSTGEWYVLRSEDSSFFAFPWGANGDLPAPGDYDGDGKIDAAVFRPSNSNWFALRSTAGPLILQFGTTGDRPVPNAFVR